MSDALRDSMQAAGATAAAVDAYAASRSAGLPVEEDWMVHPLNLPVLHALNLTVGCWVYGFSGHRCGFRHADAEAALAWRDMPPESRQRLPLAINAILEG